MTDPAPCKKVAEINRAIRAGCVPEGGDDAVNWIVRRGCSFEELKSVIAANDQIGECPPTSQVIAISSDRSSPSTRFMPRSSYSPQITFADEFASSGQDAQAGEQTSPQHREFPAENVTKRLVEHADRAGFVVMKRSAEVGAAMLGRDRWASLHHIPCFGNGLV